MEASTPHPTPAATNAPTPPCTADSPAASLRCCVAASLPDLPAPDRRILAAVTAPTADLAALPERTGLDIPDLIAWFARPDVQAWLAAYHDIRRYLRALQSQHLLSISTAALVAALNTATDPVEKRRLAVAILRAAIADPLKPSRRGERPPLPGLSPPAPPRSRDRARSPEPESPTTHPNPPASTRPITRDAKTPPPGPQAAPAPSPGAPAVVPPVTALTPAPSAAPALLAPLAPDAPLLNARPRRRNASPAILHARAGTPGPAP